MLKGLDPLLSADLLHVLRAMGHGDELVIVDANFPATSMGRRVVRMDGVSATRTLEAVLSVMPLDDFVDEPCARMQVVDDPDAVPEICKEFQALIDRAEGPSLSARQNRAVRLLRARPPGLCPGANGGDPTVRQRAAQDGRDPPGIAVSPHQRRL
jgi:L-fucose mutarotase